MCLPEKLKLKEDISERTCSEWKDKDIEIDSPLEFHPRYMHCLISYGRKLAQTDFKNPYKTNQVCLNQVSKVAQANL